MTLSLTAIPASFGSGGANMIPGGSGGSPSLGDILREHRAGLLALEAAGAVSADLAATTVGKGASLVGIYDVATLFTATDVEGALAEVKALADAAIGVVKRTVTVGHADLTDAVNGEAQAINIGATLPANARIAYCTVKLATPFTGGSASAVAVDIGTAGDVDAIRDGVDVFAAAVDGQASSAPFGIAPNKHFVSGGAQLLATFTPDGGHTLLGLSAGSCTIDVFYFVGG